MPWGGKNGSGNIFLTAFDFRDSIFSCIVFVVSFLKSFVERAKLYKSIWINKIKLYCFPKSSDDGSLSNTAALMATKTLTHHWPEGISSRGEKGTAGPGVFLSTRGSSHAKQITSPLCVLFLESSDARLASYKNPSLWSRQTWAYYVLSPLFGPGGYLFRVHLRIREMAEKASLGFARTGSREY